MNFRFKKSLSLLSGLLLASTSLAVENSWTWSDFVSRATQNNQELKASEQSYKASGHQVQAAYSGFFPQIAGSVSATESSGREYAVSLTATQNLFAGFQDSGKISQAKANLEVAKASLQSARARISYQLKTALANLVYAENYVRLSESILKRRELNLRMVQLRVEGGRENKGSLLLSRAYLEESRLDYLQAQHDLEVAQDQVAKVLGEESGSSYKLTGKIPLANPPAEKTLDFKSLVLETPEYRTAIAQEELSKSAVTLSQVGFYPSLNLSATTSQFGPTWYPEQDRWSVGATLSVPLFNGGRDYFSTRAALESLRASAFSKSNTQKDQLVSLKNLYMNYVQAVQLLKVAGFYVEAAEVREKISRQKYNNGLSTFDDWDLIESDLIKRQKSYLISERDRVISEAAWEQAQGKGVLE